MIFWPHIPFFECIQRYATVCKQWYAMAYNGVQSHTIVCNGMQSHTTVHNNGMQWYAMVCNGIQTTVCNRTQWYTTVCNGMQRYAIVHYCMQWYAIVHYCMQWYANSTVVFLQQNFDCPSFRVLRPCSEKLALGCVSNVTSVGLTKTIRHKRKIIKD